MSVVATLLTAYNTEFRYRLHGPAQLKDAVLRVVFAGTVPPEELLPLAQALKAGRWFLPQPLGLADLRDPDLQPQPAAGSAGSHRVPGVVATAPPWHEVLTVGYTEARPSDKRTVHDFLRLVTRVASQWSALAVPAGAVVPFVAGPRLLSGAD